MKMLENSFISSDIFGKTLPEMLFALFVDECFFCEGMLAKRNAPLRKDAVAFLQSHDFVDDKACSLRNNVQRNSIFAESFGNSLFLFQGFGGLFRSYFFLSFMKFVFKSHVLVPYESVGFEKRHLFIDSFRFIRIHIPGCLLRMKKRRISMNWLKKALESLLHCPNTTMNIYFF